MQTLTLAQRKQLHIGRFVALLASEEKQCAKSWVKHTLKRTEVISKEEGNFQVERIYTRKHIDSK